MADFVVKRESELDARYGGAFKLVRHSLGITSFGVAVIDLPANVDGYPSHDHSADGQEELYTALEGSAEMTVDGETVTLEPGVWVAVPPETKRQVITKDSPIKLLAIGGCPGKAFEISPFSEPEEAD